MANLAYHQHHVTEPDIVSLGQDDFDEEARPKSMKRPYNINILNPNSRITWPLVSEIRHHPVLPDDMPPIPPHVEHIALDLARVAAYLPPVR